MKKRLLSALLALALVFVLLPTTALAGETTGSDYDISINGKGWKFEKDTTSGAYIPAYYYHTNEFSADENYRNLYTNDNLMLTKEGNTVTITIRRGTSHDHGNYSPITFTLKKESTKKNDVPCIEMGNDNNLVITGKGTLNITRNESKSYGAALYSNVGDITINGGITVNVSFLNGKDYYNKNATSNAIHVGNNHNLTVSGSGTNVTATNQGFDSSPATVCVEGGTITVSGGASLSATNTYADNFSGSSVTQHFKSYAISGTESKPCTLIVADEKSSVTAWAYDEKYGKPFGFVTYNITGATVKAGSNAYYATETNIDNINGKEYVKISVPALEKDSYVYIAGGPAVVGVRTSLGEGNGYYTYNKDTKTFTLENVNITSVINAIQLMADGTYTINLVGTNTISDVSAGIVASNLYGANDITAVLSGTGSLDITAGHYAIDMQKVGNLKFENTGTIKLTTGYKYPASTCNALYVVGNVTIDKTKYDIKGEKQAQGFPTEDIGNSPVFETILKGTSTDKDLYFKSITIAPKSSETYYNDTAMKYGETRNAGSGTISCDENGVITLNGATAGTLEFRSSADSTLVLEGTNTLSSIVTTQKGLTISGSGSLTVGSIRVTNNDNISADLTINGGAHVTVNRPSSEDEPAVEVSGNLTVTGDGTQLSAECTAATNPAIEVGGNVTISGNPGTNAYTVKAYNKYATQRGRDDNLRPSQMPSAFEISGNLSISGSAQVMAQTDSDGAAVWMPKEKVISVADASLIAQNRSHNFSTISFGDESNMGNIYAKGQVNIVAENMLHSSSSLAHRAIKAYIYNHYNTGDSNPYYIKVVSEGVQSGGNVNVIPGHCTSTGGYKVTITRGDAYTTPQVAANYTIAGQTMYVGKYYKTDANGNITDGTAQDYNIYCDSKNDFTLNNATISSTRTDVAINTNIRYETNVQHHIKLIGTNRINNTFKHAISAGSNSSTIIIEGVGNASDASLTINGNFLPIYSDGKVIINAEVVIVNTTDDNSFKGLISTSDGKGAFDLGSGYKCYASTSTTGTPLEEFNSANYGTYKYLCVTTKTLETGGGSTHEHVWDEAWHDTGDYHHAHQCTICKAYDTTTQEPHNVTGHRDNLDGSHSNICGSCGYSAKVSHSYTWAPNANDNEKHIGTCVCGNVVERYHNFVGDVCSDCGYDKSTGTTCEHVWTTEWTIDTVDNEYHWHKCIKCNAITDKKPHAYTIVTDSGTNHIRECECKVFYVEDHISSDWIIDTPATATTAGSMHKECTVCKHKMQTEVIPATGEIEPPTPDNPGTIVIIRPAEEEKPAQQPNPSTGANDLVGMAVAAAVVAVLGSVALLRKHD